MNTQDRGNYTALYQAIKPKEEMTRDELLLAWQASKDAVERAKATEMELRKFIVAKAFPDATEGTNKQELGNGYELKAVVKFNYKLDPDLQKIRQAASAIMAIGNQGAFIVDRIFKWKCDFALSEYRKLEEADTNDTREIKKIVDSVLTIDEAAPTLEIKEPKVKK